MDEKYLQKPSSEPTTSRYAWRKGARRFTSKSRTGCKTCKIRRVKCDEARPYCRRCVSTGRRCDGYPQNPTATSVTQEGNGIHASPSPNREQLPDTNSRTVQFITHHTHHAPQVPGGPLHSPIYIPQGLRCPHTLYSAGSEEYSAINYFATKTLPQLNGFRLFLPWVNTLVFFSHTIPCVYNAAVALGSLHWAYVSRGMTEVGDCKPCCYDGQETKRFALNHYNLAIRQLLSSSSRSRSTSGDIFPTLLVCYLFICFENLAGNYEQASRHLRGGVALLNETRISMSVAGGVSSSSSDSRELIEQITENFRHLDMQAATFLLDWSPQILPGDINTRVHVPCYFGPVHLRFSSLNQAADQMEYLIQTIMGLRQWEGRFLLANRRGPAEVGVVFDEFLNWQKEVVNQLEQWWGAFSVLLQQLDRQLCPSDRRLTQMLRFHYITTSTFLSVSTSATEMDYDKVLPRFRAAVKLASTLVLRPAVAHGSVAVTASNAEPSFTLEIGIIAALFLIGTKCRDPIVRRELISILEVPRREGVWDSISAGKVVERVMTIEEGRDKRDFELGLKTMADIPIERRVSRVHWGTSNGVYGRPDSRELIYQLCSGIHIGPESFKA
ncbi:hypothetical protein F5Y04DRAFT_226130 [Hypomontagnella monticulosa]|nr:hypothetical protein F5Y04DRAFT_226130 [Hypomontagnella monticulosa]